MQLVTTVLNVYKRPEYLSSQYQAIKNQSIDSSVWIDYTVPEGEQMYDLRSVAPTAKVTTRVNQNLYHFGRFFYALNSNTEYVFICDDDILPGQDYLKHCIETINTIGNCVVTGYGLRFDRSIPEYKAVEKYGWHNIATGGLDIPVQVDMGGHSWFMKRETLNFILREMPLSFKNGEDLHFSYMLNKYSKIPLIVPPHKLDEPKTWSCDYEKGMMMGNDDNATFRRPDHTSLRTEAVQYYLNNDWKLYRDNL